MQRDNEINILVNMLKKEKKRAADAISLSGSHRGSNIATTRGNRMTNGDDTQNGYSSHNYSSHSATDNRYNESQGQNDRTSLGKANAWAEKAERTKTKILGRMSMGRQEAFDIFMRDYEQNQKIDENKKILKQRYADAKVFGENLNKAKTRINLSKSKIEQHRMQLAMQGLAGPDNPTPDEVEQSLRDQMEDDKAEYKETFTHLRTMKTEIEHLQHLLEKSKVQLMKDFELWWAEQSANGLDQSIPPSVRGNVKSAWRTPPLTPLQHSQRNYTQEVISPVHSQASLPQPPSSSQGRRMVTGNISASNFPSEHGEESHGYTSVCSHKSKSAQHVSNIPLTGDTQADADIMAFIKARQNLVEKVNQGNR